MRLIIGLGNPDTKYQNTRHNFGWMVADALAHRLGVAFRDSSYNGMLAEVKHADQSHVLLLKPTTYMNRSGLSAAPLAGFYKIPPEDIIAVHDDLDLPLGRLRFTPKGTAGGHNGVKSLIEALGTGHFNRLKLGIGRPADNRMDAADFVLQKFTREESGVAAKVIAMAEESLEFWIANDAARAMNRYNGLAVE